MTNFRRIHGRNSRFVCWTFVMKLEIWRSNTSDMSWRQEHVSKIFRAKELKHTEYAKKERRHSVNDTTISRITFAQGSQECTLRNVTKFGDHLRRALSIKVYVTFVENFKQTIYLLNAKKIYDQWLVRSEFGTFKM